MFDRFHTLFSQATGSDPYPFQVRLAEEGLPELLEVPTGLGKTYGAVLAWLYRRRYHPDVAVRSATARRLVYVLPMRVLVEQTFSSIESTLARLGRADEVHVHVLMGGESMLLQRPRSEWRDEIDRDSIVIGTLDMIISRCLNRGYGESRYLWPIDFGLLNTDCHFVYDEIQLMGPALVTSRQLHGLRDKLGTAAPCSSTWMSATIDHSSLITFDSPTIASHHVLDEADLADQRLCRRLEAGKEIVRLDLDPQRYEADLAASLVAAHQPGTLTLAIVNTVDRATTTQRELSKISDGVEVVLVHSRFRPSDRQAALDAALSSVDPSGAGRIVVSTQVVEAGVDISAQTLFSETAPWSSVVQRAGRCNRDGQSVGARLLWAQPPRPEPYAVESVASSAALLDQLSGSIVNSTDLGALRGTDPQSVDAMLRKRDLLELFDTLPDISGNDVDVSRFIRDANDLDVSVAWRPGFAADAPSASEPMPGRAERCPVPVGRFRDWLKKQSSGVWRWDHLERAWQVCRPTDLKPGQVVLVDSSLGGYTSATGWTITSKTAVPPVLGSEPAADDQSTADDPASVTGSWVLLFDHLRDTEAAAQSILVNALPTGIGPEHREAIITAARLHDIGKAHPVFNASIRATFRGGDSAPPDGVYLAKSGGSGPLRHGVKNFRHELASALALLGEGRSSIEHLAEPDLAVYLVAAHHGRVRMGIRSLPGDVSARGVPVALGIESGELLPEVAVPGGEVPASHLDLGFMALGGSEVGISWSSRALALRDRVDIGPFRLGYMEAVVRLADWRSSAAARVDASEGVNH